MATKATADAPKNAKSNEPSPPEEQFWQRYSPHHEAPLSGVTSTAIHILVAVVVIGLAWLHHKMKKDETNRSLPTDVVRFHNPGGGGSKTGKDKGPGVVDNEPIEAGTNEPTKDRQQPVEEPQPLPVAKMQGALKDFNNDPSLTRIMQKAPSATVALMNLESDARQALRRSVNQNVQPGAGRGGSGSDGGRDTGKDKGDGSGQGENNAALNQREKRQLRWAMTFNTLNGEDYVRQLHGLGAYVAFPQAGDNQRYLVVRNLKNPSDAKIEDVTILNRVYWLDDRQESVIRLCAALKIRPVPPFFAAFFPVEVEQQLLEREMAYLKRRHGISDERRIQLTKFDVVRSGGGKYEVRVTEILLN